MAKKEINTEQAILDAATELFLEKGFIGTSTTEIAKRVGCNQAAVHYYYRTKDKLFEAIFERKFKFFLSKFFENITEDIPFEKKLEKKILTHFDLITEHRKIPHFIINEISTNPKRLASLKEKFAGYTDPMIRQFEKQLKIEIDKGNIREIEIHDLLISIISLNIGLFIIEPLFKTLWNMEDQEYEQIVQKRKKEHVRIILASLKP